MTGQDWMTKDFYAALGVSKDADDAAIKKSYRKLARKYHPDQNQGDPKAEARFKEIGEAYAVLSSTEDRKQYDAIRAMAGGGARFTPGSGSGGAGGFQDMFGGMFGGAGQGQTFQGDYSGMDFQDLFEQVMGQAGQGGAQGAAPGGFFGRRRTQAQGGADVAAATELPFRTAVEGATVDLTVDGKKVTTRIPAGVRDGQKLRLKGKGRPGPNGGPPGDLVISVHVDKHPLFTMSGKDLRMTVPVTFAEAALGAKIDIPCLSGETVTVKVPSGTPSGQTLRVKGRGVATTKGTGDLLVTVTVDVPPKLSKEAKAAVEQFAEATSGGTTLREGLAAKAAK